jgi:hypothetical protein
MPVLELTDEQVIALVKQLSKEQQQRVLDHLSRSSESKKRPKFGSAKNDILYMAPDFDATPEDFKEYM